MWSVLRQAALVEMPKQSEHDEHSERTCPPRPRSTFGMASDRTSLAENGSAAALVSGPWADLVDTLGRQPTRR
jgi:hypothetical protein